jgi:hypothetical protein
LPLPSFSSSSSSSLKQCLYNWRHLDPGYTLKSPCRTVNNY